MKKKVLIILGLAMIGLSLLIIGIICGSKNGEEAYKYMKRDMKCVFYETRSWGFDADYLDVICEDIKINYIEGKDIYQVLWENNNENSCYIHEGITCMPDAEKQYKKWLKENNISTKEILTAIDYYVKENEKS